MRTYTFDKDYFKNINSEEKAYWLGFISADGYLNKKGNTLGISLDVKDESHLEKFRNSIQYTGKIFRRECRYNSNYRLTTKSTVEIYSVSLSKDLNNLGIDYQKSYNLKSVKVPEELMHHFIRGVFDGDGCVFETTEKATTKIYTCGYSLTGTLDFLNFILGHLPKKVKPIKDKRTENSYCIYLYGFNTFVITEEYLYGDATIYLDRKRIKSLDIKNNFHIRKVQRLSQSWEYTQVSGKGKPLKRGRYSLLS